MYQYMCSTGSLLFIPSHLIIILVTLTERKSEQAVKVKIRCKATVCVKYKVCKAVYVKCKV